MVVWIFWSVSKSIEDVASSRMIIELWRRRARAKAINCRCPWEKLDPVKDEQSALKVDHGIPSAETRVSRVITGFWSNSVTVETPEIVDVSPSSSATGVALAEVVCDWFVLRFKRCTRCNASRHAASSYSSARPGVNTSVSWKSKKACQKGLDCPL
jgi:hypothetical protein